MKSITFFLSLLIATVAMAQNDTVTFSVDMSTYSATTFTTVHLNGTFNNWCGSCNPLADPDGDDIWEVSLPLSAGTIEYKFTLDGWTGQESLTPGSPCTITTSGFTNRLLVFTGDTVVPTVCWEQCGPCNILQQVDLPITFDDMNVNYNTVSFGGAIDSIVVDPTDPTNMVLRQDRPAGAQTWAGTVCGDGGLANAIPFSATANIMSVRVWSPDSNTPVLMKVENTGNGSISVETFAYTTMPGAWETLVFDFTNNAPNTPAIDYNNTYDKAIVFCDFGNAGSGKTFYIDDIMFGAPMMQVDLPITFDDMNVDYNTVSFGGGIDSIVVDPTNPANMVLRQDKPAGAQTWAGTVCGDGGLANAIPFSATENFMSVRVWSPDSNTPVLLKVEDASNGAVSVETFAYTTMAGAWETLVFDFTNNAPNTPAIDYNNTYNKVIVFCDFGNAGSGKTFFVDDIMFGAPMMQVDLPITFDDMNVDYNTVSFGGGIDSIVVDPTDPANMVLRQDKPAGAQTWAGTVCGDGGLANAIPFSATDNLMSVRVWSPDSNTPVLLKVEDASNGAVSVETFAYTTMAGAWETLVFDFTNNAPNTPAIDYNNTYNKVIVFCDFGNAGSGKTFYVDDISFGGNIGINEKSIGNIVVSPNPTSGALQVNGVLFGTGMYSIRLMSVQGQLIYESKLSSGNVNVTLDVSNQPAGLYFMTIQGNEGSKTERIIISR